MSSRKGLDNAYRQHIVTPAMTNLTTHIAYNPTTLRIPNTEQDSDVLILKRYLLVEFMAKPIKRESTPIYNTNNEIIRFDTPPSIPNRKEIADFCKEADIPVEHWTRWVRQRSFCDEVAGVSKDSIYTGEGAAQTYITLEAALLDPAIPSVERAKIASTIAKLHLKHLEILTKVKIAQSRPSNSENTRNTLEEILDELRRNREPKLIEAGVVEDVKDETV